MRLALLIFRGNEEMEIRRYTDDDSSIISELFFETVHCVNAKDYTKPQLFAWAQYPEILRDRSDDFKKQYTLVATVNGKIVGFGSIDESGCLDMLFVRQDCLRQGIATALCDQLEKGFSSVKTYASITAKPFFEQRGYLVAEKRTVVRNGVQLINFEMKKSLS